MSYRREIRAIENGHPNETVRHHAARHWDALEPAPDGAVPEHKQRAIELTRHRLDAVMLEHERDALLA